jgi:hypothetical protein
MLNPYPDGRAKTLPLAPPMQAKEVGNLPHGEDWIYEFLWGGERVRAIKRDGGVHLISREGREFTNRFPRIAASVAKLRTSSAIIDGEILYLDSYSEPAVRFLAHAADDFAHGSLALLAYDLLSDEGKDVRQYSLLCRRLLLASIVQATPIILSPLIDGNSDRGQARGIALSAKFADHGLAENDVSIDRRGRYREGHDPPSFPRRRSRFECGRYSRGRGLVGLSGGRSAPRAARRSVCELTISS